MVKEEKELNQILNYLFPNKVARVKKINIKPVKNRVLERPEYRAKNNQLKSVIFRTRDKNRKQTRYIGIRHKEFQYYKKTFELGLYNSMERRRKNAK